MVLGNCSGCGSCLECGMVDVWGRCLECGSCVRDHVVLSLLVLDDTPTVQRRLKEAQEIFKDSHSSSLSPGGGPKLQVEELFDFLQILDISVEELQGLAEPPLPMRPAGTFVTYQAEREKAFKKLVAPNRKLTPVELEALK